MSRIEANQRPTQPCILKLTGEITLSRSFGPQTHAGDCLDIIPSAVLMADAVIKM